MKIERCDRCKTEVKESHADNWTDISAIGRHSAATLIPARSYCPECTAALKGLLSQFEGDVPVNFYKDFSKEE